ncbi:hypothetical protein, partial [Bacillus mycoides]|uniref:hypothetical protein n=1 Tax=Bacillus mycoides TaxID=1405 RepID=UPI0021135735
MNQLTFLSKIDRAATQSKLESLLEEIRIYKQFGMVREEMKVTPSYEVRYHGPTNTIGTPLEDVALENIKRSEREQYLKDMSLRIDQFLSRLGNGRAGSIQRDIMRWYSKTGTQYRDKLFYIRGVSDEK